MSFLIEFNQLFQSSIEIPRGQLPTSGELLEKDDVVKIKRCLYALQRTGHPPVTTHNVVDDWNDPVLSSVRRCQLFNTVHDRVKIVFHPEFLSSTNPLFGLDYEEFVRGCHLGVSDPYFNFVPSFLSIRFSQFRFNR